MGVRYEQKIAYRDINVLPYLKKIFKKIQRVGRCYLEKILCPQFREQADVRMAAA